MKRHKPKIAFRVDTGNIIGTGHLMEVVSLIKSLRKRLDFYAVAVVNEYPLSIEELRPLVEHLVVLPEEIAGDSEIDTLIPILKKQGALVLVADLLNRSVQYYASLHKEIGRTFILLDNDIHIEIPATVVVNFSITQNPNFYINAKSFKTEYLIGPKFALLDEDLYDTWSEKISFKEEVNKIFVNQGGSDPYGLTAKTLRALERFHLTQEVLVVVGGALNEHHRKELEELKPALKGNYRFYENISQDKMFELLSESDMALTAAGNTLYELAFFGIPCIIICHHENHNKVAQRFANMGAAINLGIGTEIDEAYVASETELLLTDVDKRKGLSDNARQIVDGYGTGRLADIIVRDIKGSAV